MSHSIRTLTVVSLSLLAACGGGGGGSGSGAGPTGDPSVFAAHAALDCTAAPCTAPTSSAVADFGRLAADVLDGAGPSALGFEETGAMLEHYADLALVTEIDAEGKPRYAHRTRASHARYRLHRPQIVLKTGAVRFDQVDYPYHSTHQVQADVDSRYYCIDYPTRCVVLHFPRPLNEPGDLHVLPAPAHTIGVQWFDLNLYGSINGAHIVDEKRWSGWLGALTDRREAVRASDGRIDYVGWLILKGGDGRPIPTPARDWQAFGTAGCLVGFTLDTALRSIAFTDTLGCAENPLGATLDMSPAHLSGSGPAQRPRADAGRITAPVITPSLDYTAVVRANDFSHTPFTTFSDRWHDLHGAIYGPDAQSLTMVFMGANSAFDIVAVRRDIVMAGTDPGTSLEDWLRGILDDPDLEDDEE